MNVKLDERQRTSYKAAQIRYRNSRAEHALIGSRVRVREIHLRDRLAPLLSRGASGAVLLDLRLRVLVADSAGTAQPGLVPGSITWEALHDLVRPASYYADEVSLKRKWVSDKLRILEEMQLLAREADPGKRPVLSVLRDDGSGEPFDDPAQAAEHSYVSLPGDILRSHRVASWGTAEISALLAAMIAERYARADPEMGYLVRRLPFGGGVWSHSLAWFADTTAQRPPHHVRVPFSERTLRRGMTSLEREGLILTHWVARNPRTGKRFANGLPRRLYVNGFDEPAGGTEVVERRARRAMASIARRGLTSDEPAGR